MVNFDVSKKDAKLIREIAKRASSGGIVFEYYDLQTCEMDVTAAHLNGCPLDLDKLLKSPKFDFIHDMAGIARHIDRETGILKHCFLPRCSR